MLYLLGLPNKGPDARELDLSGNVKKDEMQEEAQADTQIVGMGFVPLNQLVLVAAAHAEIDLGEPSAVRMDELKNLAYTARDRENWRGKIVSVVGQLYPVPGSERRFMLLRWKIQCCVADVQQVPVEMICKEKLTGFQQRDWVRVTGRVEFHQDRPGQYYTVLAVPKNTRGQNYVQRDLPAPGFYLQ
jgi:hypothetical protein